MQLVQMTTSSLCRFDLSPVNSYRWNAICEPIHLNQWKHTPLSEVFPVFHFDFAGDRNDPRQKMLKIPITKSGSFNAIVFWFQMQLDEETTFSTAPNGGSRWRQA